ncbi:MAG: bifunctional oligoribonuclease/PAP phosphatase NrnA [Elusimicrobiales bacterium]|nr:bifunctional oligoribonuclease/PAP phosphatase NrnA [Elusimicrobiales bacterium]
MRKKTEHPKIDIEEQFKKLEDLIHSSNTFFMACHINPDGDTIGSMLALWSVLRRLGKKVTMFSQDPVPANLNFLPNTCHIVSKLPRRKFDVGLMLDFSSPMRGGNIKAVLKKCKTTACIDHHKTADCHADINIVEPTASSTAEIVYRLLYGMKAAINKREATYLYVGMVTDTGRFMYQATSTRTMETAAQLMATGFKFYRINEAIFTSKPKEHLKILGRALESMEFKAGGKLAVMTASLEDFKTFGANTEHTEGIINYGLMPYSVQVVIMFREEENRINVTFRSKGLVDVALVAKHFGGGGHKQASGCKMEVPLSEAQEKVTAYVLAKIDAALEKKKNANAAKSRKKAEAAKTAPVAAAASKENA